MRTSFSMIILACLLTVASTAACREVAAPHSPAPNPDSPGIVASLLSGQCITYSPSTCTTTFTANPANYYCAHPVDFGSCDMNNIPVTPNIQTQQPITVDFSEPVYQLIVRLTGSYNCWGTVGDVTAYDRGGRMVEQRTFTPVDLEAWCPYGSYAVLAWDTLRYAGGLVRLVITPPQPWIWDPIDYADYPFFAQALYTYFFYEELPPNVFSCLTGDELLDQQAMRAMLDSAWRTSNANATASNRRESGGYVFEDSLGNLVFRLFRDPATDLPCRAFTTPTGTLPGTPVSHGHTHPFTNSEVLPSNCYVVFGGPPPPGKVYQYDTKKYGGPSLADINRDNWITRYIIDKDNIYVVPIGTTAANSLTKVKSYPRVDPATGCTRV